MSIGLIILLTSLYGQKVKFRILGYSVLNLEKKSMQNNIKIISLRSDFRAIIFRRHLTAFFKNTLFKKDKISIQIKILSPDGNVVLLGPVSLVNTLNSLDRINYINKVISIYNEDYINEFKVYYLYKIMIEYKEE